MVEFSSGLKGMALNLEPDNVGVVVFGKSIIQTFFIIVFDRNKFLVSCVVFGKFIIQKFPIFDFQLNKYLIGIMFII